MKTTKTHGKFGFHLTGGADEDYPTNAVVQVTASGNVISENLMTPVEVDRFFDAAKADLEKAHQQAKATLARANRVRA